MLKFKVTNENRGIDTKTLEITEVEQQDFTTYDIPDGDYGVITELTNETTYKFWVKDLFSIQEDSHLTSISDVVIDSEIGDETKHCKYIEDVAVTSVSKAENCLTLNVKKEIPLDVMHLYIETRYNAFVFTDNHWEIFKVDRDWIDEQAETYECKLIKTNEAAYGANKRDILAEEETTSKDNTVFYYENDSWKQIDLIGEDLEGCLSGAEINFASIHEYDSETKRNAVQMDEGKIYYTRENYIILDSYPTHYFGTSYIEYEKDDLNGVMEVIKTTDYGKDVIKTIDYPMVYLYVEKMDEKTGITYLLEIKKEVHIENINRLVFNYDDIFKSKTKVIDNGTERDINESDITLLEGKMFPYGYEINTLTGDIQLQEGMFGTITFKRDNMMFDKRYSSYTLVYDTAVNVVQIPISQKFSNDLFHNDMIQNNFVDKAMKDAINPIIDMEKDIYTPAIQKKVGEQINALYDDCFKIIFNLHFREHRDTTKNGQKEEWYCDRDCYWNGTRTLEKEYVVDEITGEKEIKKVVDLKGRVYNYDIKNEEFSKKSKYDYFSYFGEKPVEPSSRTDDEFDNPDFEESNDYKLDEYDKYIKLRDKRVKLSEYQSDLLSYLGFSNNDVKYQKSKLKKSFLRISFYDSDNIANQNLLHTSTIFLDSGELFAKYIKNIDTEDEYKVITTTAVQTYDSERKSWVQTNPLITYNKNDIISADEFEKLRSGKEGQQQNCVINGEPLAVIGSSFNDNDTYTVYNKIGVRVNREPMRKDALDKNVDFGDDIDELERLRMSSQIAVTDKYSSKHSSEGFYFYTYKSNDNGVYPSDIYMRVEFNHAGYGKTIPFMMPYIRKSEENLKDIDPGYERYTNVDTSRFDVDTDGDNNRKNKIKTFDDICYDWSDIDIDKGIDQKHIKDETDIGYGTVRYMKYCHIKWKYRYDKRTQKHIYYLDPDIYGSGVTSDNKHGNNIILNLYEGKIR